MPRSSESEPNRQITLGPSGTSLSRRQRLHINICNDENLDHDALHRCSFGLGGTNQMRDLDLCILTTKNQYAPPNVI